jgi:hypothetical protein
MPMLAERRQLQTNRFIVVPLQAFSLPDSDTRVSGVIARGSAISRELENFGAFDQLKSHCTKYRLPELLSLRQAVISVF